MGDPIDFIEDFDLDNKVHIEVPIPDYGLRTGAHLLALISPSSSVPRVHHLSNVLNCTEYTVPKTGSFKTAIKHEWSTTLDPCVNTSRRSQKLRAV